MSSTDLGILIDRAFVFLIPSHFHECRYLVDGVLLAKELCYAPLTAATGTASTGATSFAAKPVWLRGDARDSLQLSTHISTCVTARALNCCSKASKSRYRQVHELAELERGCELLWGLAQVGVDRVAFLPQLRVGHERTDLLKLSCPFASTVTVVVKAAHGLHQPLPATVHTRSHLQLRWHFNQKHRSDRSYPHSPIFSLLLTSKILNAPDWRDATQPADLLKTPQLSLSHDEMDKDLLALRTQSRPRGESWADEDGERSSFDRGQEDEEDYEDGEDAQDDFDDCDDDDRVRQGGRHRKSQRPRRAGGQRRRIHFEISELQQLYHLPLKTAAERLGVCEAALKRICRRNQIRKWPYRQLQSIRRRMSDLEDQENSRPSKNAGNRDSHSSATSRSPPKTSSFGKSRARKERTSMFLLPHEMTREQQEQAPMQADSEDSTLVKREKLELLEEERKRVISLAHLTSRAQRSKLETPTQEPSKSRMELEKTLTFEELLAWSVPMDDSLEASPTNTQLDDTARGRHHCSQKRDSALLLLANVCSNEEKIRELHARRLTVRHRDEDWLASWQ